MEKVSLLNAFGGVAFCFDVPLLALWEVKSHLVLFTSEPFLEGPMLAVSTIQILLCLHNPSGIARIRNILTLRIVQI
jgi:hypothetical protein